MSSNKITRENFYERASPQVKELLSSMSESEKEDYITKELLKKERRRESQRRKRQKKTKNFKLFIIQIKIKGKKNFALLIPQVNKIIATIIMLIRQTIKKIQIIQITKFQIKTINRIK